MDELFAPVQLIPDTDDRYRLSDGARMRSYQLRGAHKIFTGEIGINPETGEKDKDYRDGTAVHIDPGLGKTITGLTAIVEWFKWGIISKPVLLVAPILVCETVWRQEAKEWSHTKHLKLLVLRGNERDRTFFQKRQAHVHLINPELLPWLQKHIRGDWGEHYDALIVDESSMFKDNRTKRFRVLSNYGTRVTLKGPDGKPLKDPLTGSPIITPPHRFKRSAVLTGTPSPSGLQNLWAPFYLLDHGQRLHKYFETFQGRYFHKTKQVAAHVHKYELNKDEDDIRPEWQARDGAKEKIHELIADITIELNAEDYGVLPKVMEPVKHYVELPDEIKPYYRQLEKEAVFEMLKDPVIAANGGAKSMMCWQICNGALYNIDDYGKREWHPVHDAKLDKLVELVNNLDQHCLIPYWFNFDRERITARFKKEGIPYAILRSKDAQRTIDDWNAGKIPNLLIHPQSAAHGLNLQFGGHTILWYTTIWSLERWLQTIARIARSGQREIVGIHVILARHTTDELRYMSILEKGEDMERFRNAVRKYQDMMKLGLDYVPELDGPFKGIEL